MSYIPIDFVNLPSKDTPVSAENLNHMQQGIVLAVDRSKHADDTANTLNELYITGALNGKDGLRGPEGPVGPIGPAGLTWRGEWVSGTPYVKDDAVGHSGASWFCTKDHTIPDEPKHDAECWALLASQGVRGPQGPSGELSIEAITYEQLQTLHAKLTALNNDHHWKYQADIQPSKTIEFKVADLNLSFVMTRGAGSTVNYKFIPFDTTKPSTYYVKRLSNYDAVALESTFTSNWQSQAITASGFILDASGYLPGREITDIEVIDPNTNMWYSIKTIGMNNGIVLIDVVKRAVQGRIVVNAT